MIASITHLRLKSFWKLPVFMVNTAKVVQQLNKTTVVDFKANVAILDHYTLSLWNTEKEMMDFVRSGDHKKAMKKSSEISESIRTYHFEVDAMPSWKEAKAELEAYGKNYRIKR